MKKTALAIVLMASAASADVIRLKNGGALEGVVLRESPDAVTVRLKYATVTLDRLEIEAIEKKAEAPAPPGARLARWDKAVETAARRPWGVDLRQIPATVIDKGVLKNVPYISHRAGDYELNLYGDPDAPAGLEIGVHRALLRNTDAKKDCVELLASLLSDPEDVAVLRSLSIAQDKKERAGLTFEVTPETAEDAYGGWWVTVYDLKALDEVRLSDEDLKEASQAEEELEDDEPEPAKKPEPVKPPPAVKKRPPQEVIYLWRRPEVRQQARPVKTGKIRRVWVRGLHRVRGGWQRPGGIRIRR